MTGVRVGRFGHSCVRVEIGRTVIVIDPGIWSDPAAVVGADAILLTHGHRDHADPAVLTGLDVPVYGPPDIGLDGVREVRPGSPLRVAGVEVQVFGGRHAQVVPDHDAGPNVGYVAAGVCHPGDALDLPGGDVDTLLVPMQASWLHTSEAMAFLQAVEPRRAVGIHDGQINERAVDAISRWLASAGPFAWTAPGTWLPTGR